MSDVATEFLPTLGRTTLWLALVGLATATVLRLARASWPTAHRVGWVVTLLVGWTFLRMNVAIPWYDTTPIRAEAIVQAIPAPSPSAVPSPLVGEGDERSESGEEAQAVLQFRVASAPPEISKHPISRLDWPLTALSIWALGLVSLAAAWLIGYLRFVRSLPPSLAAEQAWLDQWHKLLVGAGVHRSIPLRVTADLGPMLCRLPHGYELLVPAALWNELEIGQRGAILRHELAHYLRGDVWKSLAIRVLALPHWFNPVSWWAARRFEEAAEWACDHAATAEEPPTTYAKALMRLGAAASGPSAYGSAARGPALAVRIRRLVTLHAKEDSTMKKTLLVATGLCLAALSLVRVQLVAKEPGAAGNSAVGQPTETRETGMRREVFAGIDGDLVEVLVNDGDFVKKGQVLAKMRNAELNANIADIREKMQQTCIHLDIVNKSLENKSLVADERKGLENDQLQNRRQLESLGKELAVHESTAQRLNVTSPVDGKVDTRLITPALMDGPVQQGQTLMSVAELPGDQNTVAPPTSTKPAKPSAPLRDGLQNSKRHVAEQLAEMMADRGRINTKLSRIKLHTMLTEARKNQPDGSGLSDAMVENLLNQDPHILDATKRMRVYSEQLVDEEARHVDRDHPKVLGLKRRIQKLEQGIENRKATLRPQLVETMEHLAVIPLSEKEVPDAALFKDALQAELEIVNKGIEEKIKLLQGINNVSAKIAKDPNQSQLVASTSKDSEAPAPSQKMVDEARRAFEATLAAYEAETNTLGPVYDWSLRWMLAAESATSDPAQKAAVVQAHLDRMRQLQKKIQPLYEAGTKGGDAQVMTAVNFYVAEAESRLAQIAAAPVPARAAGTQSMDLQVEIADLEAELKATEAQLGAVNERLADENLTPQTHARLRGEMFKLEDSQKRLATRLGLYKQTLQLTGFSGATAGAKTAAEPTKDKRLLRYNGKEFDAWAEELRDDLSPERRREAIQALATFGTNGYGPQAAARIIEAMRGYSVWTIDGSEGILKAVAMDAFKTIPRGDTLPLVMKALKSDSANERLLAVAVVSDVVAQRRDIVPILSEMFKDPDVQVRRYAVATVVKIDPTVPGLVPVLREALASEDPKAVGWAISFAGGSTMAYEREPGKKLPSVPVLIPEIVGLLNSLDNQISVAAKKALIDFGPEAVEALEKVVRSGEAEENTKSAKETLQRIRERLPKPPNQVRR